MAELDHPATGDSGHLLHDSNLTTRILMPVLLVLILLCAVVGSGFYLSEKSNLLTQLNLRGNMLATSLAAYASLPMQGNQQEKLRNHVEAYIKDKNLLHQVSFLKQGEPFLMVNTESVRERIRPDTLLSYKQVVYAPDSDQVIGEVHVSLTTQEIDDHLSIRVFHIVVISFIVLVTMGVLLSVLLKTMVVAPLSKLEHRLENISYGRLNQRVTAETEDEIGSLFHEVNSLRIRFKRMQKELFASILNRTELKKTDSEVVQARVFVVDDEPLMRMQADKLLQIYNMKPYFAKNGKEAIEVLEQSTFDLLLLDLMMPESNGFDVLRYLENNDRHHAMPVIVVSSVTDKTEIVRALHMHACDYVLKPYDHNELIARVQTHLKSALKEKEIEDLIKQRIDSLDAL